MTVSGIKLQVRLLDFNKIIGEDKGRGEVKGHAWWGDEGSGACSRLCPAQRQFPLGTH